MENKEVKDENKGLKVIISIADVIANAEKLTENSKIRKKKMLHSKRLEDLIGCGGLEVESVSNKVIFEAETKEDDTNVMYYGGMYVDPTYILSKGISSPILTTDEVRKAFKVNTNKDLFKKIFNEDEITEIATTILNLKGGSFTVEKELKN
ncbi:MAG: hypothetical protein ACRC7H_03910 [Plesiomonas shigelloides]|uniref:hypothetical protein n=1 Tax=Cetobacterium sp. TaxID=2071632 RepID=UPI003F41A013